MAVKRWIWWVLGTLAFFGLIAMAGIGACVYFVASHFDAKEVTATQAEAEFEAVRARFKDQKPLLEIKRNGQVLVDRLEERAATYKGRAARGAAHPRVGTGRSEAGADHAADVAAADEGHDGPQVLGGRAGEAQHQNRGSRAGRPFPAGGPHRWTATVSWCGLNRRRAASPSRHFRLKSVKFGRISQFRRGDRRANVARLLIYQAVQEGWTT